MHPIFKKQVCNLLLILLYTTLQTMKDKINITLDRELLGELKEKAKKEDRSLSSLINHLLKKVLRKP